ncbi:AP-3 complex subunit sigma, partial [Tanacetum coccineum]
CLVLTVLCLQPENVSNFIQGGLLLGPVNLKVSAVLPSPEAESRTIYYGIGGTFGTKDTRLVYKLFATLYFIFVFDSCENELAMFDLIQVYVETLEKCFSNVCELDIVLNYDKLHTILNEMILGGQVVETDSEKIMHAVEEISKLEKVTATTKIISKSASLLWG